MYYNYSACNFWDLQQCSLKRGLLYSAPTLEGRHLFEGPFCTSNCTLIHDLQ